MHTCVHLFRELERFYILIVDNYLILTIIKQIFQIPETFYKKRKI